MFEQPEIHVIDFSGAPDDERRAERERQQQEARRRYLALLETSLVGLGVDSDDVPRLAAGVLDCLFDANRDEESPCSCTCHPHLPATDFHDYGFACPCQRTADERRRHWQAWRAKMDAYWASPEGQQQTLRRQAQEDELVAWLAGQPDVVVTRYGGVAPEQWSGTVEGRKFYFRERHGDWRIELDLRPTGRYSKVWQGGALDDDDNFELRDIEEGDVIAEGSVGTPGYGDTPVERGQFIVRTIREHIGRARCRLHTAGRAALEVRFGVEVRWCPACGAAF